MTYKDFMYRVYECYFTNLECYPDENPTLDGAFREILELVILEIKEEKSINHNTKELQGTLRFSPCNYCAYMI